MNKVDKNKTINSNLENNKLNNILEKNMKMEDNNLESSYTVHRMKRPRDKSKVDPLRTNNFKLARVIYNHNSTQTTSSFQWH